MKKVTVTTIVFCFFMVSAISAETYVVKPGETLAEIALKHETSVEKLIKLNQLKDKDRILAGYEIIVSNADARAVVNASPTPVEIDEENNTEEDLFQLAERIFLPRAKFSLQEDQQENLLAVIIVVVALFFFSFGCVFILIFRKNKQSKKGSKSNTQSVKPSSPDPEEEEATCFFCQERVKKKNIKRHLSRHVKSNPNKEFECELCGQTLLGCEIWEHINMNHPGFIQSA